MLEIAVGCIAFMGLGAILLWEIKLLYDSVFDWRLQRECSKYELRNFNKETICCCKKPSLISDEELTKVIAAYKKIDEEKAKVSQ